MLECHVIMTRDEILHLGEMARIKLTDDEVEKFTTEIDGILGYVSTINDIVADYGELTKKVGLVHNVFREDEVTNQPGEYTEALTAAFPEKEGPYLKVKKILSQDN